MKKLSPWDRFFMFTVPCQGCGGKIRFPLNKGKLRVTCPHCKAWFIFSFHPGVLGDLLRRRFFYKKQQPAYDTSASGGAPYPVDRSLKKKIIAVFIAAVLVTILINVCQSPFGSSVRTYKTIETVE